MRLFTLWRPEGRAGYLGLLAISGVSNLAWGQTAPPASRPAADTLRRVQLSEVVVAASRVEESLLQSPVTVEKLSGRALRLTPAPTFFDALEGVKGVQVITPSLGFKVLNARGFANTTNVRFVQLVDGIDNQAPHIGGPIGNALGPSDLDIGSVEIVPGSAAALYGLNAINGLANFSTRSPFTSEGLSAQQRTGLNHVNDPLVGAKLYSETSVRYAKVLRPRLALKLNGTYSRGYDWIANDQTELNAAGNATTGLLGADNPARDPVNSYGNESSDRITFRRGGKTYSVARTGYDEREVVDYGLQTIKADAALHYKLGRSAELAYTYRLAVLDNVYQRSNRFRLQDYRLQQHALQLTGPVVQARAYVTGENTGRSYNLRSAAENLDRTYKPDNVWIDDYGRGYDQALAGGQTVAQAHAAGRTQADAGRYQPGTALFRQKLSELQDINNWDQGAALRVQASLVHAEAQVNVAEALRRGGQDWLPAAVDVLAGLDHRTYVIVPDGNYFINPEPGRDPLRDKLTYGKTGGFGQAGVRLWQQKVRLTATLRADKNDYFDVRFNPRFTAGYSPTQRHNFRVSYQSGYRFPSLFEAFSNVNSGQVKRIGGLRVMSDGVFENSYLRSSIDAFNAAVTASVNANTSPTLTPAQKQSLAIEQNQARLQRNPYTYLRPEQIRSLELGYKAALLPGGRLLLDVDAYYNAYRDFIAQVEAYVPKTLNPDSAAIYLSIRATQNRYRLWTNAQTRVYNYGGSVGLRYERPGGLLLGANATYARLARTESGDGLEDGFNTPRWMANLSLGHEHLNHSNIGFGVSYHWQQHYYSQTFLVSGEVPAYGSLDAQLTYVVPAPQLRLKLGATNVLNQYYASFLGGPGVGGLYYLALTYTVE
ncbi:TonB-dependent receptor [Hymenobacter chitinivorans]|uniref:Iron complex outermembrane receptor protein n=1 Tax=Hymenobacter chitinivorans DSM 11115 TaxID=1121954 RepID=A0A2M9BSE7_9BACT|nr:TonB-dependent receptor [Hymenobacter chitinivorans]PJJ60863.1 iron complex outermembrane receptor protein [Hymenobacter chitinivorans DSM 11115]